MEIRDILDSNGNIIGSLEMPEGTSEERWAEVLAPYSSENTPTLQQMIEYKVSEAEIFGAQIIFDAKVGNVAQGITQAGKTKEVSDYLRVLGRYLREGSLYPAIDTLDEMIISEIPEDLSPYITVERLTATKNRIQDFLNIPRT